jgi:hypothetical protein
MTTQAHPPSENQQLEDARIAMEQAIVRIGELERQVSSYRKAHAALTAEIEQARQILGALENETLIEAANDIVREEQTSNEAYHKIHARYWKEAMPALDALSRAARAVVEGAVRPPGSPSVIVSSVLLDALARCVSSNSVAHEPAQKEETQVPPPWIWICPRCGLPLDNISRGISIVSGSISVCTSCLNPGETEIARARSLT